MPVNVRDSAGTRRDKQGQSGTRQGQTGKNRDKLGQPLSVPACPCLSLPVLACPCLSLSVPVCPCLSLSVHVYPCLSLSFPVCPCLSLYVSRFAIPAFLPLQTIITVFISMNMVTLTWLAKATVPMHANLLFNFFSRLYF